MQERMKPIKVKPQENQISMPEVQERKNKFSIDREKVSEKDMKSIFGRF